MEIFLIFLFAWLPCTFYAATVSSEKGYSGFRWGFGAFLFGPIALIAAVGLPNREQLSKHKWDNDPDIKRAMELSRSSRR
jgi:hypothetical protein